MSDIKRFFKHSSIYAIGNIINRVGAFVLLPVYTNYLSVAEYGIIEIFYVISSVISGVLAIGLAHATLRFYFDYENQSDRNAVVSTNFIGSFLITSVGSLFIALAANNIVIRVFDTADYTNGIYIILATLIFELSSQICLAYIRAIEYSIFFVGVSIAKLIIQVSVNTYLVINDYGVTGVLLGNMITVIAGWAVLSFFTIYRCGIKFQLNKFTPVLKYSFPFLLGTIMGLISSNVDKFALNYLISIEALGLYALSLKFSMILEQLVGEPFSRSYGSFRYSIMKNPDADKMQASIVKYLLMLTVFLSLAMSYFSTDVLHIMSAKEYWPAASLIPIVMISSVIKIMIYPEQSGILFSKNTKYFFYFTAVSALISLAGNFIFIPIFGLVGACMAMILTDLSVLIMTHNVSQRYFPVKYEYKSAIIIIFMAVIFFFASRLAMGQHMVISIIEKTALLFLFGYLMFKLPILSNDEKSRVSEIIKARLGKK